MTSFKHLRLAPLMLAGLLVSCAVMGPEKMVSTHVAYNEAVQLTTTREVLVNVVRGRYSDPMSFLKVEAINASFSVNVGATAGIGGIGQASAAGDVGTSAGYSESPTITFVPQSDAAFYKSIHSPMDMEDVFGLLHWGRSKQGSPGWEDRALRFMFASINGAAENGIGQGDALYDQRVDALARLMAGGAYLQQVPEWAVHTTSIARDKVTADDQVNAFGQRLYFVAEEDGQVRLSRFRLVVALVLPEPEAPEVLNALDDLGVERGRSVYIFRPPAQANPGSLDPFAIWVTTRSLVDVMTIAAQFVSVPDAHSDIVGTMDRTIDAPVRFLTSETEPPFPFRVQHRGYWFYIDDADIESKVFLRYLVGMYKSRIGTRQAEGAAPQLVLPIGGKQEQICSSDRDIAERLNMALCEWPTSWFSDQIRYRRPE